MSEIYRTYEKFYPFKEECWDPLKYLSNFQYFWCTPLTLEAVWEQAWKQDYPVSQEPPQHPFKNATDEEWDQYYTESQSYHKRLHEDL